MYFQDILQEIASNLMDSNLFQQKSSTQVGASHLEIFTDIFSTICGTFFLGIPDEQFNLGHLAKVCHTDKRSKYLKEKLIT